MNNRRYNGKPVNKKKGRPLLDISELRQQNKMWDKALSGIKPQQPKLKEVNNNG